MGGKCGGVGGKSGGGGGGVPRDTMTFYFVCRRTLNDGGTSPCSQSPHIISAGRRPSKSLRESLSFSSFAFFVGFLFLFFLFFL